MGIKSRIRKSPLATLVDHLLNTNFHPPELNKEQISVIARNFHSLENYFLSRADNMAVPYILGQVHKSKKADISNYVQNHIYPRLLEQKNHADIRAYAEQTGIQPTAEQKQALWNQFFSHKWSIYDLSGLIDVCGIPPLSQEQVSHIINALLTSPSCDIPILDKVKKTIKILGKKPVWDKKLTEECFYSWLGAEFNKPLLDFLQTEAGVQPNPTRIQQHYKKLFNDIHTNTQSELRSTIDSIEWTLKSTSIPPKPQLIQRFYQRHFSPQNIQEINRLSKLTQVSPTAELIHRKCQKWFYEGDVHAIMSVEEKTGIELVFEESAIQKAYTHLLKQGDVHSAREVNAYTEVEPKTDAKTIYSAISKLIDAQQKTANPVQNIREIHWLLNYFPKQVQQAIRMHIREQVRQDRLREAQYCVKGYGITPFPEEEYVFACARGDFHNAKKLYDQHKTKIRNLHPTYAKVMEHVQ